jgi:hypothetical protein
MEFNALALVSCPECQKEVSTHALACPQCAFPFPGKQAGAVGQSGTKLHACPDCGCPVSKQAQACPHCGVPLGEHSSLPTNGNAVEETWLCPHCGTPYTRKVHREENVAPNPQVLSDWSDSNNNVEGSLIPHKNNQEGTQASPRRRSPLWQDSAIATKVDKDSVSTRYPRSRRKSILLGLLVFILIVVSVVSGALWQLQGINPLEILVYWRM